MARQVANSKRVRTRRMAMRAFGLWALTRLLTRQTYVGNDLAHFFPRDFPPAPIVTVHSGRGEQNPFRIRGRDCAATSAAPGFIMDAMTRHKRGMEGVQG